MKRPVVVVVSQNQLPTWTSEPYSVCLCVRVRHTHASYMAPGHTYSVPQRSSAVPTKLNEAKQHGEFQEWLMGSWCCCSAPWSIDKLRYRKPSVDRSTSMMVVLTSSTADPSITQWLIGEGSKRSPYARHVSPWSALRRTPAECGLLVSHTSNVTAQSQSQKEAEDWSQEGASGICVAAN